MKPNSNEWDSQLGEINKTPQWNLGETTKFFIPKL